MRQKENNNNKWRRKIQYLTAYYYYCLVDLMVKYLKWIQVLVNHIQYNAIYQSVWFLCFVFSQQNYRRWNDIKTNCIYERFFFFFFLFIFRFVTLLEQYMQYRMQYIHNHLLKWFYEKSLFFLVRCLAMQW